MTTLKRFILVLIVVTSAILPAQQNKEKISFRNESLRKALETLSSKSGFGFVYSDKLIEDIKITCDVEIDPQKALDIMLNKTGIVYKKFDGNTFVLFKGKGKYQIIKPVKPVIIQESITEIDSGYAIQKAILVSRDKIIYPLEAVNKNIEGKATVKFLITAKGDVDKVSLKTSSGSNILDSATVNYARKLKFLPAQANGKSINIWMMMSFDYYCVKN